MVKRASVWIRLLSRKMCGRVKEKAADSICGYEKGGSSCFRILLSGKESWLTVLTESELTCVVNSLQVRQVRR